MPSNLPVRTHGTLHRIPSEDNRGHLSNNREYQDLDVDQAIMYQDVEKKTWSPGTVVGVGREPRSYTIKCDDTGSFSRCNHILAPHGLYIKKHTPSRSTLQPPVNHHWIRHQLKPQTKDLQRSYPSHNHLKHINHRLDPTLPGLDDAPDLHRDS